MQFEYTIVYGDRSTVGITVERDRSVVVHVPQQASLEQIGKVIERKKLWIYEKINHSQKYDRNSFGRKELASGASVLYLGESYTLGLVADPRPPLRFDGSFHLSRHHVSRGPALFEAWYRSRARNMIVPMASVMAKDLGVLYRRILISDLRYRWGSCTSNGTLNFNWRLIKAPISIVRYVVAHELAHLLVPNHSADFWNIVSIQAPDYQRAKEWLKINGNELERDF